MDKKLIFIIGYIEHISEIQLVQTNQNKTLQKIIITLKTEDNQKLFLQGNDNIVYKLQKSGILEKDQVKVGFIFMGAEKNKKYYNNLLLKQIDYV